MNATKIFPPDVLADIYATARQDYARVGRGVLFVKPMPDATGHLDSEYFYSIQLLTLASLKEIAGFDLVSVACKQVAAYNPDRQCVLLWMTEDQKIYCETIDNPQRPADMCD